MSARSAITNTLLMLGVTAECADDLRLAVSDACTNVILHAASDDDYEVAVTVDERQCAISVKNAGSPFDAASLAGVVPSRDSVRGRGVAIMRAVMDNVDLTSTPEAGTIVHLVTAVSATPNSPLARLRPKASDQEPSVGVAGGRTEHQGPRFTAPMFMMVSRLGGGFTNRQPRPFPLVSVAHRSNALAPTTSQKLRPDRSMVRA